MALSLFENFLDYGFDEVKSDEFPEKLVGHNAVTGSIAGERVISERSEGDLTSRNLSLDAKKHRGLKGLSDISRNITKRVLDIFRNIVHWCEIFDHVHVTFRQIVH